MQASQLGYSRKDPLAWEPLPCLQQDRLGGGAATIDGDRYVNNSVPGSEMYCGVNNLNGALLKAQISVDAAFSGIRVELVIGSEEEG